MNNLLISLPMQGFLWLLLLFVFCFLGVHILKLALLGRTAPSKKASPPQAEKEEKKTPAEKPQEPVYYIVERKTRRAKSTYGEPKEIRFK